MAKQLRASLRYQVREPGQDEPSVLQIFNVLAVARNRAIEDAKRRFGNEWQDRAAPAMRRDPYLMVRDWITKRASITPDALDALAQTSRSRMRQLADAPMPPVEARDAIRNIDTPAAGRELEALLIERYPELAEDVPASLPLDAIRPRLNALIEQLRDYARADGPRLAFARVRIDNEAWEHYRLTFELLETLMEQSSTIQTDGYVKGPRRIVVSDRPEAIEAYDRITTDADKLLDSAGIGYPASAIDDDIINAATSAGVLVASLPSTDAAIEQEDLAIGARSDFDGRRAIVVPGFGQLEWRAFWESRGLAGEEDEEDLRGRDEFEFAFEQHAAVGRIGLIHVPNLWRTTAAALEALAGTGSGEEQRAAAVAILADSATGGEKMPTPPNVPLRPARWFNSKAAERAGWMLTPGALDKAARAGKVYRWRAHSRSDWQYDVDSVKAKWPDKPIPDA